MESEQKAFNYLVICRFIAAKVPMVLGYTIHEHLFDCLSEMIDELKPENKDVSVVLNSEQWQKIKSILENE